MSMLDKNKHREIMYSILRDIFSSDLGKYLAFKGGTACYFFHGLDRFSTDLDFDLVDQKVWDIDEQIIEVLKKYGDVKIWKYNIILSYETESVNVKIDISRNIRKHNIYEIKSLYGVDIKTQAESTIFANKLVALTERNTNRDIYDVYFFLKKHWNINENIIKERTWKTKWELLEQIIEKLKNLPKNYKILDWLGEVLNEKQKHFVSHKLLVELIGILEFERDFAGR